MKLPEPPKLSLSGGNLEDEIAAVEAWAMSNDPMWVNWHHRGTEEGWGEAQIYRVIAARQLVERYRLQNELIEMVEPNDQAMPQEERRQ